LLNKTSLVVGIRVTAENFKNGEQRHANTSYFKMVAKDDEGKPTLVPRLILETEEKVKRFLVAMKRRDFKKEYIQLFTDAKSEMNVSQEILKLNQKRCIIAFRP